MNDIINIDITDLLLRLYLFQGLSIIVGVYGIIGMIRYKKMFLVILVLIGFFGFFKANDRFNDKRDQRIIQSINVAGIPVDALAHITIPKDGITEITFTNKTTDIPYKFNVLGEFWRPDTIKLQLKK